MKRKRIVMTIRVNTCDENGVVRPLLRRKTAEALALTMQAVYDKYSNKIASEIRATIKVGAAIRREKKVRK